MKHSLPITFLLLGIFLLAQFIGLGILYQYIDPAESAAAGETKFKETFLGERPPVEEKTSFVPVIIAILVGTGLLLLLIKLRWVWVWKFWFLLAVIISLAVAGGAFLPVWAAITLGLGFGIWKIFRPNIWVHNFTEIFIYGGLAAIVIHFFNLLSASVLLIFIAAYDAYAVWKSKHMVTLAQSQAKAKMFAGLLIPYKMGKLAKPKGISKKIAVRTAILGGGDIGFPLFFAGAVLKELGLWQSLIIPFFALGGLAVLLYIADEKKFYPAMPFIAIGCFVGLGVVWVIELMA